MEKTKRFARKYLLKVILTATAMAAICGFFVFNEVVLADDTGVKYPETVDTIIIDSLFSLRNWALPNNVKADDNNYTSITSNFDKGRYSRVLRATNFGFNIPEYNIIKGIKIEIERYSDQGSARDEIVKLTKDNIVRVGGNKANKADDWPASLEIATYGGETDLWGTTWTREEINSPDFGVHLQVKAYSNDTDIYADFIRITVYYIPVGNLVITKNAIGGDDTFNYKGTGSDLPSNFDMVTSDGSASQIFNNIPIGSKTVMESVLPADWDWDFTNLSCNDPDGKTTVNKATANIDLDQGETITCTFTNTKRGSITVVKVADPDEGPFGFALSGPTSGKATINNSGSYVFKNLLPGSYSLVETSFPEEWQGQSTGICDGNVSPDNFDLSPGGQITCYFNNKYSAIAGRKFHDLNANGVNDGEPNLTDWTISLFGEETEALISKTTDTDGLYIFSGLMPGVYQVCETPLEGWFQSFPAENFDCGKGYRVNLNAGEIVPGLDFGNYQKGSISGLKFDDFNADGEIQEAEQGLAGWTIELYKEGGEIPLFSQETNENGFYYFDDLELGNYAVREVSQNGWLQTNSTPESIFVSSGNSVENVNFGNFKLATITGQKWNDLNANGLKDDEEGLSEWTVTLEGNDKNNNPVNLSVATDEEGVFSFSDVFANLEGQPYRIIEERRDNWQCTSPTDCFFDVLVTESGQEITTDTEGNDLQFGNIYFEDILGGSFAPTNGEPASTSEVIVLEETTISVSVKNGTSTVSIPAGTVITRSDNSNFDISDLSADNVGDNTLSNLGRGVVVKGALQWGIENLELEFNPAITLDIFVGNSFNGQTLEIVRSTSGSSGWTNDGISPTNCLVTDGFCTFKATKASFFAATSFSAAADDNRSGSGSSGNFYPVAALNETTAITPEVAGAETVSFQPENTNPPIETEEQVESFEESIPVLEEKSKETENAEIPSDVPAKKTFTADITARPLSFKLVIIITLVALAGLIILWRSEKKR